MKISGLKNVTFLKPPILNFEKNTRFSPGRYGELIDLHSCHVRLSWLIPHSLKRSFYIAKKAKNAVFIMSTQTE